MSPEMRPELRPEQRLRQLRTEVRGQLDTLSSIDCRRQFHPELSPMAWHVGHSFFTEAYWVQEIVCGDNQNTARWHPLYVPEYSHKQQRGLKLPENAELLDWTHRLEVQTDDYWQQAKASNHPLIQNDYLVWFLVQHYAQHLETMAMVRQQASLTLENNTAAPAQLSPIQPTREFDTISGGSIRIGGQDGLSYDNELSPFNYEVADFALATHPVTNGQWLAFMQDGGYSNTDLWETDSTAWLTHSGAQAPQHWRPHSQGGWYCPDPQEDLATHQPVHGLCWHEAMAYARWAGARLLHEYEWEYASRTGELANVGQVWEWCENALHPYPGFKAFPYDGYSKPWFDGHHRIARGSSRYTQPEIRRPSFRNFYPESHRHVFAGLRLAKNN